MTPVATNLLKSMNYVWAHLYKQYFCSYLKSILGFTVFAFRYNFCVK